MGMRGVYCMHTKRWNIFLHHTHLQAHTYAHCLAHKPAINSCVHPISMPLNIYKIWYYNEWDGLLFRCEQKKYCKPKRNVWFWSNILMIFILAFFYNIKILHTNQIYVRCLVLDVCGTMLDTWYGGYGRLGRHWVWVYNRIRSSAAFQFKIYLCTQIDRHTDRLLANPWSFSVCKCVSVKNGIFPILNSPHWRSIVVQFNGTPKSVSFTPQQQQQTENRNVKAKKKKKNTQKIATWLRCFHFDILCMFCSI